MRTSDYTTLPLRRALPRLLERHGISMRQLARKIGVNHSQIARMISGDRPVDPGLVGEIGRFLGLPQDYFAEAREAAVIDAILARPRLRDEIYFERLSRRRA